QVEGLDRYEAAVIGEEAAGDRRHARRDNESEQLVSRNVDAERLRNRLARMNGAEGAPGPAAQQIDADEQADGRSRQQHEIPETATAQLEPGKARRLDKDAGRKAALGLVFAAEIDDNEMQRQCTDREIEPAQPQRRQAEHETE